MKEDEREKKRKEKTLLVNFRMCVFAPSYQHFLLKMKMDKLN